MNNMNSVAYLPVDSPASGGEQAKLMTCRVCQTVDEKYQMEDGSVASQADGLGTRPIVGDYVAYMITKEGNYIISLLKAAPRESMLLSYPSTDRLKLFAEHIELIGKQSLTFRSLQELSLETCRNIRLVCENLFQTATNSVVSVMSNWVQQCDQGSIQAKDLLRTDANNQIITAGKDMRIDAERINMG